MNDEPNSSASADPATASRSSGRASFIRAHRGVGRAWPHAAIVAAGTDPAGSPARMVLPVDRPVTITVRYLPTSAPFTVSISAPSEAYTTATVHAERAMRAAAEVLGLTGAITGALRTPNRWDSGADMSTAVVHAAVNALCDVAESPASDRLFQVAGQAGELALHTLPAPGPLCVHDTTNARALVAWETFPRFFLLYAFQALQTGGIDTYDVTTAGSLSELTAVSDLSELSDDPQQIAAWLHRASTTTGHEHPLRALFEDLHASGDAGSLGVLGGHGASDPVALILPADGTALTLSQRARTLARQMITSALGEQSGTRQWRVTGARVASAH